MRLRLALGLQLLDQPLERQVLVGEGAEAASRTRRQQLAEASGRRDRSARSTSVLTKKPIRSSSSTRGRGPAIGVPDQRCPPGRGSGCSRAWKRRAAP